MQTQSAPTSTETAPACRTEARKVGSNAHGQGRDSPPEHVSGLGGTDPPPEGSFWRPLRPDVAVDDTAGHGPPTTLGAELDRNPFLAELRA